MKNGILAKEGRECGIRTPPPFQTLFPEVMFNIHTESKMQRHVISIGKI